jgi:hypothetical protein
MNNVLLQRISILSISFDQMKRNGLIVNHMILGTAITYAGYFMLFLQ